MLTWIWPGPRRLLTVLQIGRLKRRLRQSMHLKRFKHKAKDQTLQCRCWVRLSSSAASSRGVIAADRRTPREHRSRSKRHHLPVGHMGDTLFLLAYASPRRPAGGSKSIGFEGPPASVHRRSKLSRQHATNEEKTTNPPLLLVY